MTRERYLTLSIAVLKDLAKARHIKGAYAMKKNELIEAMLAKDAEEENVAARAQAEEEANARAVKSSVKRVSRRKKTDESEAAEQTAKPAAKRTAGKTAVKEKTGSAAEPADGTAAAKAGSVAALTESTDESKKEAGAEQRARSAKARDVSEEKPSSDDTEAKEGAGETEEGTNKKVSSVSSISELPVSEAALRTVRKVSAEKAKKAESGRTAASRAGRKPGTRRSAVKSAEEAGSAPAPAAEQPADNTAPEPAVRENGPVETESAEAPERESQKPVSPRASSKVRGILEVMQDGFGFIRSDNFLPGENDIYVSPSQIRRFALKTGDMVCGMTREKAQGEKFGALLYVETVNDFPADECRRRMVFEQMTPVFPHERISLERPGGSTSARIVDLLCPIGKGQRGMIVSPPKAGKTTLLKDIAKSILYKDPEANLLILLVDERPEEVTDMKESVTGKNVEIIYSTFDELPEHHRRVSEMVIERAKRLVEHKQDVVILLDSITRLARACNVLVPPSGRTLSGGLDPTALYMPKRFFGAARKMREGGSLTILATALVDTGSKMDDVVYEEFKGTGNMELILDRKLQERRIFPAIDIAKSGTRRDDLLLTKDELEAVTLMRRSLSGVRAEEATDAILNTFARLKSNAMVISAVLQRKLF